VRQDPFHIWYVWYGKGILTDDVDGKVTSRDILVLKGAFKIVGYRKQTSYPNKMSLF
jgi:hypothetical protein